MLTRKSKSPSCANISIGFPPTPEKSRLLPKEDSGRLLLTSLSTTPGSCELSFSRVLHPKRRERLFSWLMMLSWPGEGSRSSVFSFFSGNSNLVGTGKGLHIMLWKVGSTKIKRKSTTGLEIKDFTSFQVSMVWSILSWYIPWALHVDLAIIFGPTMLKFNESKKSAWTKVSEFLDGFLDYQASQKSNVFVSEAAHRRLGAGPSRPQKKQQFLISFSLCNLSQTSHSSFNLLRNSHFSFVWPVLSLWSASKKIAQHP